MGVTGNWRLSSNTVFAAEVSIQSLMKALRVKAGFQLPLLCLKHSDPFQRHISLFQKAVLTAEQAKHKQYGQFLIIVHA